MTYTEKLEGMTTEERRAEYMRFQGVWARAGGEGSFRALCVAAGANRHAVDLIGDRAWVWSARSVATRLLESKWEGVRPGKYAAAR